MAVLLLFFLLFILGFAALYAFNQNEVSQQRQLKSFAERLEGGRLTGRISVFGDSNAKVEGHLGGREVKVIAYLPPSKNTARTWIRFKVEAPNSIASFTVGKTHLVNRVGRSLGVVNDTPIGDDDLDKKFLLKGRAQSIRAVFRQSPKLEWCFDSLFRDHGFSEVEVRGGYVHCERPMSSADGISLVEVVRALSRVAALCERKEVQIRILGDRSVLAWSYGGKGVRCPYCRDDVDLQAADLTACPVCRTVHHTECLSEAGGCTLLGCSEAPRRVSA